MEESFDEVAALRALTTREGRRIIIYGRDNDALNVISTTHRVREDMSAKRLRDALWEFLHPAIYEQLKEIFKNE